MTRRRWAPLNISSKAPSYYPRRGRANSIRLSESAECGFLRTFLRMIVCPNCLHLLAEPAEQCLFCGEDIDSGAGNDYSAAISEWKIARTVTTAIEATLIAGRLRGYGIPAVVVSQVDSTRGFTVGALAVAKVFVPEDRLA